MLDMCEKKENAKKSDVFNKNPQKTVKKPQKTGFCKKSVLGTVQ